jgi:hypothetical protein
MCDMVAPCLRAAVVAGAVAAGIVYLELLPEDPVPTLVPGAPREWAHRGGIHDGLQENTPPAFLKSIENGFRGFEMDIYFDAGRFVVSHDLPYALYNGTILTLSALLAELPTPSEYFYWLDFKNLKVSNRAAAAAELDRVLQEAGVSMKHVVVEAAREGPMVALGALGGPWVAKTNDACDGPRTGADFRGIRVSQCGKCDPPFIAFSAEYESEIRNCATRATVICTRLRAPLLTE